MKYPKTPYWPWSASADRAERTHRAPEYFVGREIVITEKLDGTNTRLHRGVVYGRSSEVPSAGKWMAMVRKHHAWKLRNSAMHLYGEDLYGVHSIAYDALRENETLHAFALRHPSGRFTSFDTLAKFAAAREIPTVPVINRTVFESLEALRAKIEHEMAKPSLLGPTREGIVIRVAEGFESDEFERSVCKSVRPDHVQTDKHWRRSWRPCAMRR